MRTPGRNRGPSPVNDWSSDGIKSGRGSAKRGLTIGQSKVKKIWGKTPNHPFNQTGLTDLFELQNQLKADLQRQARLAKLDWTEVRSTEAERLRMVNQRIVDASSVAGGRVNNPFASRHLTEAQIISESMILSTGKRQLITSNVPIPSVPRGRSPVNRRKTNQGVEIKSHTLPPFAITLLRGPLARCFHRAVVRGYQGSPNQWLRGPVAAREILKLRQRGVIDPFWSGKLSLNERGCPMQWVVNSHSTINYPSLARGFFGERLRCEPVDTTVLARQARAVKRLPRHQWPRDSRGHGWPTYPTLSESWACFAARHSSYKSYNSPPHNMRTMKLPSRQVLPGLKVRVLSKFLLGLRADVPVPKKFLGYFSYRWGFLILNRTGPFPAEFASFLADSWKRHQTSMYLSVPLRYNDALRLSPSNWTFQLHGWKVASEGNTSTKRPRERRSRKVLPRQSLNSATTSSGSDRGVRLF
jgi:hypothetical protein